ncbi:head GIN domain-containing protein [Lutibacter sp. TH_r2]|uniref:head GIN domain-containing protein n=1 Tax=Lutibacter sp. TH_r2 TaxID=3082083 RepID=UPI002955A411|nr:head GIN domain-containing protein [Lutibacter sp. TH_r2]MDV7186554.1 head GIN domain-containing protein [Lutibacter sp. TH_r2]
MKKIAFLLFFTVSLTFSQETITKRLGDFDELKVFNGLNVELEKSSQSKIEISGNKAEDITVKNSNGTLKIRLKFPEGFVADDVKIKLFYNEPISVIDANEGAVITSSKKLKQPHLEVKVQEGAGIILEVNVKHLEVKCVTGGIINLSGKAENQTIETTTGGNYSAYGLDADTVIVTAASGARAEVIANESLNAQVRFGGKVRYKGTPEVLKTKKTLGGSIQSRN